jgi:hypothetical protein
VLETGEYAAGGQAHFVLSCECVFAPGRCDLTIESGPSASPSRFFRAEDVASFVVTGENAFGANVIVPHEFTVQPAEKAVNR